jgi:hypothetical protein
VQVIHREDDEIYETLDVELNKKKDRGLGLSIVGKKSGPGVFISEVVKGGAADIDGRLVQGDQVTITAVTAITAITAITAVTAITTTS